MKRLLNYLLFLFTLFIFFTCSANGINITNFDISDLKEISAQIKQPIYDEMQQRYLHNLDIVSIAKKHIQTYYNKKTFKEPEWIRVNNFLTWLDKNKDSLNADFYNYLFYYRSFASFHKFSSLEKESFIGSFLGANYITQNITGKKFELQIFLRNKTCTYKYGGICISAVNIVSAINSAIHETTHMLLVNDKNFVGNEIKDSEILSEKATIFFQLKYALPLKICDENILLGSRANFTLANKEFIIRYLDRLFIEYAEAVPAITEYSKYSNKVSNILTLTYTTDMSIARFLSKLLYYRALSKYVEERELTDIEFKFAINPVYKETVTEVYNNIYAEEIDKLEHKSVKTIDLLSFELFEDNKLTIAITFFKNLKKYADKNIPPTPKGYI